MRKHWDNPYLWAATVVLFIFVIVLLCGCSGAAPVERPDVDPTQSVASAAAHTSKTEVPVPTPTLTRWVGVFCSPEGSYARSRSGVLLVCKKVGSDRQPEWHAAEG